MNVFWLLYSYDYYLKVFDNPIIVVEFFTRTIFIYSEFLIASLLINSKNSNVITLKKNTVTKKSSTKKKSIPQKEPTLQKKLSPIKKPTKKKKPTPINTNPEAGFIKSDLSKMYSQKNILLNRLKPILNKQQQISLVSLNFSIVSSYKPSNTDFEKIERDLKLLNLTLDSLKGYSGWDKAINNLISLPKEMKELIFMNSIEFLYVVGKLNKQRTDHAQKIFTKLGISSEQAMNILGKAKAFKKEFDL